LEDPLATLQAKLAWTESALVRAEQLALAGRFAAMTMHEINNPLEVVTNFAYLIRTEPLTEVAQIYLTQMEEHLSRLREIARQSLTYYRACPHPQTTNLTVLLQDALRTYAQRIAEKEMNVRLDLQGDAHFEIYPADFIQAISNLISNAIDASERGGQLRLRLRMIRTAVHITICDSGSGVPHHLRATLFDAFATGKSSGHGLGLWICKRAIDKHHGRILWRSSTTPGRSGTAFRISLMGAQAQANAA
jgi:signal transduction histidine kinase